MNAPISMPKFANTLLGGPAVKTRDPMPTPIALSKWTEDDWIAALTPYLEWRREDGEEFTGWCGNRPSYTRPKTRAVAEPVDVEVDVTDVLFSPRSDVLPVRIMDLIDAPGESEKYSLHIRLVRGEHAFRTIAPSPALGRPVIWRYVATYRVSAEF
jgi:hypothetical protein